MPTLMLPSKSFRSQPLSETTLPLVGHLFGDSQDTGASQGILLAPTTKPTPDEGIQYCIVKQMPTPWIHCPLNEIPVFTKNTSEDIL